MTTIHPTILKLGGELLETPESVSAVAQMIAGVASNHPLIVVHGGGREIDAALARAGIEKRQVDGLRITDEPTLSVVVAILAGAINTRLVAAIGAAGGQAVGLTGADAGVGPVEPAPPHRSPDGRVVSLGLVGQPVVDGSPRLLECLLTNGFVPIVACIGSDRHGRLFNVNADTLAAALAIRVGAERLVISGTTPGVKGEAGLTLAAIDERTEGELVASGTVNAGMLAKLQACRQAVRGGVKDVAVVDGRGAGALYAHLTGGSPGFGVHATQVVS